MGQRGDEEADRPTVSPKAEPCVRWRNYGVRVAQTPLLTCLSVGRLDCGQALPLAFVLLDVKLTDSESPVWGGSIWPGAEALGKEAFTQMSPEWATETIPRERSWFILLPPRWGLPAGRLLF